jgi:hypothetical protein
MCMQAGIDRRRLQDILLQEIGAEYLKDRGGRLSPANICLLARQFSRYECELLLRGPIARLGTYDRRGAVGIFETVSDMRR